VIRERVAALDTASPITPAVPVLAEGVVMFGDEFLGRQRLLVIAPHADDETYGCAGTIARIKSLGGEVYVVLASVGDLVHFVGAEDCSGRKLVTHQTRLREFEAVMKLLKVDDWDVLFTDSATHLALDTLPRKSLVGLLEYDGKLSIGNIEPTMVMIPAISYNQITRHCSGPPSPPRAQGFPAKGIPCRGYSPTDNTSLFWSLERERFHPTFYVDISTFLAVKVEALRLHASQVRHELYHGSPESLELATRVRGREVSVAAAEGFSLLRALT
jgi:LmbE family N-acetylglucosaminyl deacetylase